MAFTIPNDATAAVSPQADPDAVDIDILVAGQGGTGVISGCAVSEHATPNMNLTVAAGAVRVGTTTAIVSSGNVTITTAHATLARFDLVVVGSTGTKSVTAGTAATDPVFPAIPANSVVLAAVYVPATDTVISSAQIVDKRVILASELVSDTAANLVIADAVYPPGLLIATTDSRVLAYGDGTTSYLSLPKFRESFEPVRAETTTQQGSVNSGTPVDRTDLAAIDFTVGTVAWDVEYYEAYIKVTTIGTTGAAAQLTIADGSNVAKSDAFLNIVNVVNNLAVCRAYEHITTPGSYTRKGRVARVGTSAVLQYGQGAATSVSWIEARPTGTVL